MTAPKQTELFALLAKNETSYGGGGALSASADAIWLAEPIALPALEYLHDGMRRQGADSGGGLLDAIPKGRALPEFPVKVEARGAGSAYSASNFSRDLHRFLKAAGWKHTVDTTGGAEKVTYVPSRLKADWLSIVGAGYSQDQLLGFYAAWCDTQFDIEGPAPAVFTFPTRALVSALPSDAAIPALTFQAPTLDPPRCEGLALYIKDVTSSTQWSNVPVRRVAFRLGRVRGDARVNLSVAGGHSGFSLSPRYSPTLELAIEASALAASPFVATTGLDPYSLRDTKRKLEIGFGWGVGGTGNYNRLEFKAAQAQVRTVADAPAAPDAVWTIGFHLACSAPGVDDACELITK